MHPEIEKLQKQKQELARELETPAIVKDPQKLKKLSIEYSRIERRLSDFSALEDIQRRIREAEEFSRGNDEDMKIIAAEELKKLTKEKQTFEKKLTQREDLPENLIMEIRAGAGGDEASLFAADLFQMYSHYAAKRNWKTVMLDESKSDLHGYKEVIFEINGEGAYAALRWESGVHRVQRIPETEKSGRIHTSTASVAVLPQAKEVDIEIRPQDIKIEFFRSSGPGGQNVNKVETAVRITHTPSGVIVASQESRSQMKNREHAMAILRAKLYDAKMQEQTKKIAAERKEQIGTGDRSEKIRTYNFPQDRVTDHRIKESWHNLPSIMEGNIDPIIEALQNSAEHVR